MFQRGNRIFSRGRQHGVGYRYQSARFPGQVGEARDFLTAGCDDQAVCQYVYPAVEVDHFCPFQRLERRFSCENDGVGRRAEVRDLDSQRLRTPEAESNGPSGFLPV